MCCPQGLFIKNPLIAIKRLDYFAVFYATEFITKYYINSTNSKLYKLKFLSCTFHSFKTYLIISELKCLQKVFQNEYLYSPPSHIKFL